MSKKEESQTALVDDFTDDDKVKTDVNLWKYNEVKELLGVVKSIEEGRFNGKKITLLNHNNEVVVLPELSALNSKLKNVEVGKKVKIVYLESVKAEKSGRYYEDFDVFIK